MAEKKRKSDCGVVAKDLIDEKALVEAAKNGDYIKAKELLDLGVAPDTPEYNKQLFYQSENYMTPLHYATANGYSNLVKLFITRGGVFVALYLFLTVSSVSLSFTILLTLISKGNHLLSKYLSNSKIIS